MLQYIMTGGDMLRDATVCYNMLGYVTTGGDMLKDATVMICRDLMSVINVLCYATLC